MKKWPLLRGTIKCYFTILEILPERVGGSGSIIGGMCMCKVIMKVTDTK
jgi:hypothetical protein